MPHGCSKHTVFGQVVEGYNVIKAIESVGSRSGATSVDVSLAVLHSLALLHPELVDGGPLKGRVGALPGDHRALWRGEGV